MKVKIGVYCNPVTLNDLMDVEFDVINNYHTNYNFIVRRGQTGSTSQVEHLESQEEIHGSTHSETTFQTPGLPNEAHVDFADFMLDYLLFFNVTLLKEIFVILLFRLNFRPIDLEEEEAVEEAIRRSLEEESVQSLQESRYFFVALIS